MSPADFPVVFIHRGYSPYVRCALAQAQEVAREIILLSDRPDRAYGVSCRHERLEKYLPDTAEFDRIYLHLSHHDYAYEHFCIQRWFFLAAFMREHGLEQVIHLDTDALLYRLPDLPDGPWTLTLSGASAHACVIRSRAALEEFCDFCLGLYRDPDRVASLCRAYHGTLAAGQFPSVSDMTLFRLFKEAYPEKILDFSRMPGPHWDLSFRTISLAQEEGNDLLEGITPALMHFQGSDLKMAMPWHASPTARRRTLAGLVQGSLFGRLRTRKANLRYLWEAWKARNQIPLPSGS